MDEFSSELPSSAAVESEMVGRAAASEMVETPVADAVFSLFLCEDEEKN
jgi:hypothetical protein